MRCLRNFARVVPVAAVLFCAASPQIALAFPLAPNIDTYMALGMDYGCGTGVCASTSNTSFSATVTQYFGPSNSVEASLSATAMHALDSSQGGYYNGHYFQGFDGELLGVAFYDLTVSGPTPTVQIGVSIHSSGTASQNPGYSSAGYYVAVGARNPSPRPDYSTFDFLDPNHLIVVDGGFPGGVFFSNSYFAYYSVDRTATGNFTATVGSTFELGYMFNISAQAANVNFGDTFGINYSVPDGYTLTIDTGVPEPETYAMLLAGLGLLGFVARRRKQKAA